jgi:hypothetical protein
MKAKKRCRPSHYLPICLTCWTSNGVNLSQTDTILKYLARKYDLMGTLERSMVDLALDEVKDMEGPWSNMLTQRVLMPWQSMVRGKWTQVCSNVYWLVTDQRFLDR